MIPYLDADAITSAASEWAPLIDAADSALDALASGDAISPLRSSLDLDGGTLLVMPGRIAGDTTATVKLVSVMPQQQPTIQGVAVLFDATTGTPVALLDGASLTAVRTAAVSAAAARRLTSRASVLGVFGSGAQAPWQVRALSALFPLERIHIWSPNEDQRSALATRVSDELGIVARAVADPEEAARDADLVVCATTADQPFLQAPMLATRPVTVVAIGAYRPDMGEIGPSVFREAGKVYVDDASAVLHEGGDVLAAIASSAIGPTDVVPIGALSERPTAGVRLFKSVGSAAQDAAIAAILFAITERAVGQNALLNNNLEM